MGCHNIGDKVHYMSLFGPKEVKIIDKRILRNISFYGFIENEIEYLIEFPSGRKKVVKEIKLF